MMGITVRLGATGEARQAVAMTPGIQCNLVGPGRPSHQTTQLLTAWHEHLNAVCGRFFTTVLPRTL
jgi:hypothetical protein